MPWRETKDPYLIWISEIILQQTRVAQGYDYYVRFIKRFPGVASLAAAKEEEVLKYWQGLGYYSRARNLHAAAKDIMERFDGRFPQRYEEVLSLKGIGEYTAAAIVSFVWEQPYPVVDGNVFRVLSRVFGMELPIDTGKGKKAYTELARLLLDPSHPALHNQAIMEFGALQCVPQTPDCTVCPFVDTCVAYDQKTVALLPVKQNKTKTRDRYFNYLFLISGDYTFLHRRGGKDIWEGLYELPLIETGKPVDFMELKDLDAVRELLPAGTKLTLTTTKTGVKHVLSHQVLYASFYKIDLESGFELPDGYRKIPLRELDDYAVPRLIHSYLLKAAYAE